jgi:hypothetical protein
MAGRVIDCGRTVDLGLIVAAPTGFAGGIGDGVGTASHLGGERYVATWKVKVGTNSAPAVPVMGGAAS